MNILGTLLDILGKSKDGLNVKRNLVGLKFRPELASISSEKKIFIPPACYTLTKKEKRCVLKTLSRIKVPEGYSSNIRNIVSMTDLKLNSLKSHDYHVLIQQLFPIALRSMLPKHVRYAITRLCIFFNSVCNKVLDAQQLNKLEEDIVVTLCLFEKYFPPLFFTIMIHLIVHIVREVKLCGPIYLRWMYPFERFMKVIKNSVRNRYCQESYGASIGENGAKLKSFIRYATHYHVPITYTSWKSVPPELKDKIFTTVEAAFVIDPRSRKNILQTASISFRQFKNWITTKYIMPHKDDLQLLQAPPEKYSFIEQNHWEEFVRSRLSETFQV
ncbi:hypothetical protein IC582_019477 [Cucumis melo]